MKPGDVYRHCRLFDGATRLGRADVTDVWTTRGGVLWVRWIELRCGKDGAWASAAQTASADVFARDYQPVVSAEAEAEIDALIREQQKERDACQQE